MLKEPPIQIVFRSKPSTLGEKEHQTSLKVDGPQAGEGIRTSSSRMRHLSSSFRSWTGLVAYRPSACLAGVAKDRLQAIFRHP